MPITKSTRNSEEQIFQIFINCRKSLEENGIFQWTRHYPGKEHITMDIANGVLYQLEENNILLGVICINSQQELEYSTVNWFGETAKSLVVHRLAIDPQFQNQGHAKTLMAFAEEMALDSGCTSIRLDAYNGNKKALRFYKQLGYYKRGQVFFPERELPFTCFERTLE